ncbi:MAG: imidazolonepropionase [Bacteroidetes bacterium]|nr:imidazolonepropionase [Bacteroidota bacterium]
MKRRFTNIGTIYGLDHQLKKDAQSMAHVETMHHAYMEVSDGNIIGLGSMDNLPSDQIEQVDLGGRSIAPLFVDCHTHIVFAEPRVREFEDRLKGLSYQEIAERGGGILNSARKLAEQSEEELFAHAMDRIHEVILTGTGAIEIKSGYGLSPEAEWKMLRVIRRLKDEAPIPVKATFLGAHAIPERFAGNADAYLDEIEQVMLPVIQQDQLADYIDIFCEQGYFNLGHTERILKAGKRHGLKGRIHVNQFNSIGGIQTAAENDALSVEHLEVLSDEDLNTLRNSNLFAVALPGCSFFLKIPYTPARQLIEAAVPLVLASDYNPGSAPTGNLLFAFSLANVYMGLLPTEAFNALTINAAYCLEVEDQVGSITPDKRANFMVLKPGCELASLGYNVARPVIDEIYLNGSRYSRT